MAVLSESKAQSVANRPRLGCYVAGSAGPQLNEVASGIKVG
jgi:hypothetical protein